MKIAYSQPIPTAYRIASTGSAPASLFVNSTQDALCDGKPARKTRVSWCGGAQSIATHTRIVIDHLGTTHKPAVAALLGLSLPEGTKIEAQGRLADLVNPSTLSSTRTVKLPDGTVAAWFILPVEANADSFDFIIYNDVNGASPFTSTTQFDIGEAVFMPAINAGLRPGYVEGLIDPSTHARTLGGQFNRLNRKAYRRFSGEITPSFLNKVRGSGLENSSDWQKLRNALLLSNCVVIPSFATTNELYRTAIYGQCQSANEIAHVARTLYSLSIQVEEIPS